MAKAKARPVFTSVAAYLAAQPLAARRELAEVRRAIRRALPNAEEVISYGIPAYRVNGRVAIYFAGFTAHYSIYPATAPMVEAFRRELEPYEHNGKGTIRFPLGGRVPVALIGRLAKFRAKQVAGA